MTGVILIIIGLVLCFLGVGSMHAAVLAAGFALGWLVADLFNAAVGTALLVGAAGAVIAWVVASLILRVASLFLGVVTGAVIGARLFELLSGKDTSVLLGVIFIPAMAVVGGLLAHRYRERALLWLTALGGAGVVLTGLSLLSSDHLSQLGRPETTSGRSFTFVLWLVLAGLGWWVQRRVFAKRLNIDRSG